MMQPLESGPASRKAVGALGAPACELPPGRSSPSTQSRTGSGSLSASLSTGLSSIRSTRPSHAPAIEAASCLARTPNGRLVYGRVRRQLISLCRVGSLRYCPRLASGVVDLHRKTRADYLYSGRRDEYGRRAC